MTLNDITTLMTDLLTNIAQLLLTPPYFWFTGLFVIGSILAIINRILNLSRR